MKLSSTLTIPLLWATLAIHVPAPAAPRQADPPDTGGAAAADRTSQPADAQRSDAQAADAESLAAKSARYARTTELLGRDVQTMQGQPLGELRDIVIEPRTGAVKYAVLSRGGALGVGAQLHAVPLNTLSRRPDGEHLIGKLKPEQLDEARGFDDDNWPDAANQALADPELAQPAMGGTPGERGRESTADAGEAADRTAQADRPATDAGTRGARADQPQAGETGDDQMAERAADEAQREVARIREEIRQRALAEDTRIVPLDRDNLWAHKASELVGTTVRSGDENLGTISDLVLDFQNARVSYAILSYGGTLGVGDRRVAVPWSAVDLDREEDVLTLDADRQTLDQLAFEGDGPDFNDPQWAQRTHRAFGTEPEQDVFGYSIDTEDREGEAPRNGSPDAQQQNRQQPQQETPQE